MLSRTDVARIAVEEGLAEWADSLVDTVRPGWRLEVTRDRGRSKIGGDPDFAPDEQWPVNGRGIPMTFLAQIDCAALPAPDAEWRAPRLPEGRLLRVFGDLVDCPFEPGPARVLSAPAGGELVPARAPAVPDPWPPGGPWDDLGPEERVRALPEAFVRPVPFLTAPEAHPVLSPDEWPPKPTADAYYSWANRLRVDGRDFNQEAFREPYPWELHHVLGTASSIQDDVRGYGEMLEGEDEDAWEVLVSLHYDERIDLEILDGGAYTVLVPAADLAAGVFDRAVCGVDSS